MYRMPEKQSGSRNLKVLNCTRSCFYQYANHLPNHLLSIKLKYPDFFYRFSICFVSFYIILCKLSSFMLIYAFKKKKTSRKRSSAWFHWRQKCQFWMIPRYLFFRTPFVFWLSRFYKLSFRLFIPTF